MVFEKKRTCLPPGGQGRPPLRVRACLHWCGQICSIVPPGGVEPLPYANLAVFAIYRKLCDFAGASWRVDVGIDPYKHFTVLHWCIRFCGCVLPGGQGRPPLRVHTISHWRIQFFNVVLRGRGKPRPYVTTKNAAAQKTGRNACSSLFYSIYLVHVSTT